MSVHAALVRRVHGLVRGGDEGAKLVSDADRDLAARGVAEPATLARWLA